MQKEIKICFFTSEKNKRTLQFISYYKNDIYLLKFFSNNVVIATRPHEIPWDCDLYCSWWLAGSIVPFFISKLKRKPLIILGQVQIHVRNSYPPATISVNQFFKNYAFGLY